MRTIKVVAQDRFWCVKDGANVAVCFPGRNGRRLAIECAVSRIGEGSGNIQVYTRAGRVIRQIAIKGEEAFPG